jgi:hypothetical protein
MKARLGDEKLQKFVELFKTALDDLDEANEYSRVRYLKFPLLKNNVYFTIEVMVDVMTFEFDDPEIAIRCRHNTGTQVTNSLSTLSYASMNQDNSNVLFLWSYEKFKERVELMAEWYSDLMDDGILNRERYFDPWIDFNDEDIKY